MAAATITVIYRSAYMFIFEAAWLQGDGALGAADTTDDTVVPYQLAAVPQFVSGTVVKAGNIAASMVPTGYEIKLITATGCTVGKRNATVDVTSLAGTIRYVLWVVSHPSFAY